MHTSSYDRFAPLGGDGALRSKWLCSALTLLLITLASSHAIGQVITANIVGSVTDSSGAVIGGASVKARNGNTGYSQSAVTGGDGTYRIQGLPIGPYDVEITMSGFQKLKQQNIVLSVDQTFTLNVSLTVGATDQSITVTTAPPTINLSTSQVGQTVLPEQITQLPLVNRSVSLRFRWCRAFNRIAPVR